MMVYFNSEKFLTDWILLNRCGNAFKNYSPNKIVNTIRLAAKHNMFAYYLDERSKLVGVVCGEKINSDTCMVHDILVLKKGVLRDFIQLFLNTHPGCKLIGKVGERDRVFVDPHKLWRRLK